MKHSYTDNQIIIASHNPGKVSELQHLVQPLGLDVYSLAQLDLPAPREDGDSFVANAEIKARAAASVAWMPAFADDSGLCVNALNGQPGLYSRRWAGRDGDFKNACKRIASLLDQHTDRRAQMVCALSLSRPDGETVSFEGRVSGQICWPPRGDNGVGYESIFVPDDCDKSLAQLDDDTKYLMGPRYLAFSQMLEVLAGMAMSPVARSAIA